MAGGNALPVELTDFQGKIANGRVELSWVTASELNNDYFAIEKSTDGINFGEVAQVKGKGTTKTETEYTVFDELPSRKVYYRLRQFDFDQRSTVSEIIMVDPGVNEQIDWITVYPNPVNSKTLHVSIRQAYSGDVVSIVVSDITGRKVVELRETADGETYDAEIPCESIQPGIYILTASHRNKKGIHRIVIQR